MIQKWHFNCTCSLCLSQEAIADSDRNKHRIQGILNELRAKGNQNPEVVEVLAKEMLGLLELERLDSQTGDLASILVSVYVQMHDLVKAREYAHLAMESHLYYSGYDSKRAENARAMMEFQEGLEYS